MNQVVPCTIKFNNYLVIMEKKTDIEKINSYEHLVEKLKKWEVSPQETWNLIQKIKFKGSPKTIWKMSKFHMYIRFRMADLVNSKEYNNIVKISMESKLMGKAHMNELFTNIQKILPKKVDTIRKLVKSEQYKFKFEYFNKNKKFDERSEVKNLEKLIADKRQEAYWDPELFYKMEEIVSKTADKKPFNFSSLPGREMLKALR